MKKWKFLFLFLLWNIFIPNGIKAQCVASKCTENGYDLNTKGEVGVLVIFAEIDCSSCPDVAGEYCDPDVSGDWPAGQLPNNAMLWSDPDPFGVPTGFLSRYYYEASFEQLRMYSDIYSATISVSCSDLIAEPSPSSHYKKVIEAINQEVLNGNADFETTQGGYVPGYFDLVSGEGAHGSPKGVMQNSFIDAIAIIWKNNLKLPGTGYGFRDASADVVILDGFGNPRNIAVVGDWNDNQGDNFKNFIAEYIHALFGHNNWHSGSGAAPHTFPFQIGNFGMTAQGAAASLSICAWDRYMLGWQSPYHANPPQATPNIGALDGQNNIVDANLLTPGTGEQVFILRDFYKTGDAVRIKLPHFNFQNDGDVKNQYLWIENHQRLSEFDVSKFEEFSCTDEWQSGLYAYLQVGKDLKSTEDLIDLYPLPSSTYANKTNGLGSWLYPLPAEGRFDFVYREDLAGTPQVSDCPPPIFSMPFDKALSNDFPNPFTGSSDLVPGLYDLTADGTRDGVLEKGVDNYNLGYSEVVNGEVVYNLHKFGDGEDAFQIGRNSKIGIGTNPSSAPVYTLMAMSDFIINLNQNQPNLSYENRTIWLNGISVEIIEEIPNNQFVDANGNPSMDLKVRVRWDDYLVDQDTRWCGNIVLQDDPNDSWQAQVVLGAGKKIILDQGTSPTKFFGDLQTNGTYLFAEPTVMTVKAGTKLHLLENSNFTIKNGATLIIEDGAEVLLEQGACIVVEETGALILNDNNIHLNGDKALLSIRGTLKTNDNVDFTFTGNGYADFYPNHILDMGNNSHFILNRDPADVGTTFLLLQEETTLSISDRNVRLNDGRVEQKKNTKLALNNVDFIALNTDFLGEWTTSDQSIGIECTNASHFDLQYCEFTTLPTSISITGNTTVPAIRNNTFSSGNEAIVGSNMDHIILEDNYFNNFLVNSIRMEQIDYVGIQQNVIDHALTNHIGHGCVFTDVNFASLYLNTTIQNCDRGVLAERSNVFVNNGSVISDNNVGVEFINNSTAEWLLSVGKCKCAHIINNDVGIGGENVILDIDAYEHQFECNSDQPSPNRFDGNTEIFDICFTDPDFPFGNTILARGNYWGGQSLSTYPYTLKNGPATQNCLLNGIDLSIDDSDFVSDINTLSGCGIVEAPYPQTPQYPTAEIDKIDCEFNDKGSIVLVHEQSRAAFEQLYDKNYSAAVTGYTPVAALDRSNNPEHACVNKINIARCLVKAINSDQYATPNSEWYNEAIKIEQVEGQQLLIYPNPASSSFTLEPTGTRQFQIRILNTIGQTIYTTNLNQEIQLDINNWPKGIYLIESRDNTGQILQIQKLLVQ